MLQNLIDFTMIYFMKKEEFPKIIQLSLNDRLVYVSSRTLNIVWDLHVDILKLVIKNKLYVLKSRKHFLSSYLKNVKIIKIFFSKYYK